MKNNAVKAIAAAGGAVAVASKLNISAAAVRKWQKAGKIPPKRILPVCRLAGGAVSPHELDPQLYPKELA